MRRFVERALRKVEKLNPDQTRRLIADLAHESARVRIVLDSMSDGVIVADEENRLLLCNRAAERLLPLDVEENSEQPIWRMIHDRRVADFVYATLMRGVSARDEEFVIDETDHIVTCDILPLAQGGRIEGNIVQIVDVTEKRARESQLRRAESLASFTTMAAGVAHEIKNPLGSIGIHIQLIRRALTNSSSADSAGGADSTTRISGYLDVVDEEMERLNRIIVNFLFAIRPVDLKPKLRDLNEVVRGLIEFVRIELEDNGIEVQAPLADCLPRVEIDEKYIKQALLNIIKNAQSAMPDGGILRITTYSQGETVSLEIADSGVGMTADVQRRIFEPYFTTRDFGSGIGMTLVYKIIKEHRGDIGIVSSEGNGTTITLLLPVPQRERRLLDWGGAA